MSNNDNSIVVKTKRSTPEELRAKIAELQSLYSDPNCYYDIRASITSARDCLSLIYLMTYFRFWETESVIKAIAQNAYAKNYEGEWSNVQDFLEYKDLTTEQFEALYIERFGPHDFFGNFLKRSVRISRTLKFNDRNKKDTRPVRKPQFRRGYNDKGTLRLPHEYHGERPYRDTTERIDRRRRVAHPLLSEGLTFSDGERPDRRIPNERI